MSNTPKLSLHNAAAELTIDAFGGAITCFTLPGFAVNPLSFSFSPDQMPENNRGGAVYQGHFACIGRWGEASNAEKMHGIPNHGEPANCLWQVAKANNDFIKMQVRAAKDGLQVNRLCTMDESSPVFLMKETVTNTNATGKPFNMVQHPTLSAPFLDEHTIIDCNAGEGFDQVHYKNIFDHSIYWNAGEIAGLRGQQMAQNAVFSFIVNNSEEYGWVTAYSPTHHLLLGYVWRRSHYPWLHHWQHFHNGAIQYRGIEFGTAGIHQPFKEIVYTATRVLGEKTLEWLDAGESTMKSFYGFVLPAEKIRGIKKITVNENAIIVMPNEGKPITMHLSNKLVNGLYK